MLISPIILSVFLQGHRLLLVAPLPMAGQDLVRPAALGTVVCAAAPQPCGVTARSHTTYVESLLLSLSPKTRTWEVNQSLQI